MAQICCVNCVDGKNGHCEGCNLYKVYEAWKEDPESIDDIIVAARDSDDITLGDHVRLMTDPQIADFVLSIVACDREFVAKSITPVLGKYGLKLETISAPALERYQFIKMLGSPVPEEDEDE